MLSFLVVARAPVWTIRSQASPGRGRDVEKTQLHALLPVPAVDRERARRVHGTAAMVDERGAELLARGAERDGVDARTVARAQAHAQMRGADLVHISELMARQSQDWLRIAGAEGPSAGEQGRGLEIGGARGQRAIDREPIGKPRRGDRRAEPLFEIGAKRPERFAPERHPGRHGMAAALEQKPLMHRLPHRMAEIDPNDRAAGPGADAADAERDRKRGTAEALLEPRRNEAHHARMPALRGRDHDRTSLLEA